MAAENRIFRTPEAASYLGLAAGTLEVLRRRGDGPAYFKLGKRAVGYERAALDAWVERRARVNRTSQEAGR